jgi:unsaturated chondroitin disaccharide hydrolase
MAEHLTHTGVHDHGFNNISTYGNLRRLMLEGRIPANEWELHFYELALKVSGAVQAARWTSLAGWSRLHLLLQWQPVPVHRYHPHFAHLLSRAHAGAQFARRTGPAHQLLDRALTHAKTSARYNVYYGEGRDPTMCRSCAAEPCMKPSSIRPAASSAALLRSRVIRRSLPGPEVWPGECSAFPS